ncbi:MAG: SDR family oxidoreductase [Gammaproteobacteria bacterium]|uniref:SDR family oxidoreductase n=1 Tax=Pseudomaricurvus alcaniphilus TaxID=1166482 RepID=UPI00140E5234|nr:SDR family oxidoreductase [Pseudomaricurvus alcaniphilus]MBR9910628.1 SDR family oxidoreductase [Gammaproteobacteria bacterium]NHN36849.1 SDR family oxidoreductase [Pseudomaricurvus alcaniphilus]
MLLANKVIVISGIGPGLGIHLASLAVAEGASVVLAARSQAKLDQVAEKLIAGGVGASRVLTVATDICRDEDCRRLVDACLARFGRIDALINSAYNPGTFGALMDVSDSDLRAPLEVNYFGTMTLTRAVVPSMLQRGRGCIVMVNTMAVHQTMHSNGGYAASKAALSAASANLAMELGPTGIRVNSVYLGWMWGPSVEGYMQHAAEERGVSVEAIKQEVASKIALRRIPTDKECAKVVLMLASDYASAMTGASVDVNGGEYIPH